MDGPRGGRTERAEALCQAHYRHLEHLLSPHHKNIFTTRLGMDAQQRLERDMKQGCRAIAQKVLAKYGNGMTQGMQDRYNHYSAV